MDLCCTADSDWSLSTAEERVSAILHFPKAPEGLEWFRRAAEEWANFEEWTATGPKKVGNDNLLAVYRYLKWSHIYGLTEKFSIERTIAYGFVVKYYRIIHFEPLVPPEDTIVRISETALQSSNEAIRRKKGTKHG
jgi:hypothetical protein